MSGAAELGDHPLRLAQRVGADQHAAVGIVGQALEQLADLLLDRRMAEHRQAEGRFGDEYVARRHFEWRTGGIGPPLVVAGHHHPFAGVLEQDLRRAEHVAGGHESRGHAAGQGQRLAIGDRPRAVRGAIAQAHDRQRRGRGDRLAMPAARVVGVAVGHQRAGDRLGGIDPAIRGGDVDPARVGPDPCEIGDHGREISGMERRFHDFIVVPGSTRDRWPPCADVAVGAGSQRSRLAPE